MPATNVSLVDGWNVNLTLNRGLISVEFATGPVGSELVEYRWTLAKKNALSRFNGPPNCTV